MSTPRKSSPAKTTVSQAAEILGDNMGETHEVPDEFRVNLEDAPVAVASPSPRAAKAKKDERITIVLEDNDEIPPGGQFVGVDGVGYQLQSGVELRVPRGVVEVLDAATTSVPIKNAEHQVIGYRSRLRFPYRIITETRKSN